MGPGGGVGQGGGVGNGGQGHGLPRAAQRQRVPLQGRRAELRRAVVRSLWNFQVKVMKMMRR
jgi:hypothetical protein